MATRFASTVDLLALLSEKIHNRNLLHNLCLTNRAFNAIFSCQLYKCLRWDESNVDFLLDPEKLLLLLQSGHLAHTRVLIILDSAIQHVRAHVIDQGLVPLEEQDYNRNCKLRIVVFSQVNRIIVDIVKQARGLNSFACQRLAVSQECMDALSTCPDLQTVAIEFTPDSDAYFKRGSNDNSDPMLVFPHAELKLSAFSGLQRLSLHKMWGDISSWETQLLQVLLNSPHLKHISLSISEATRSMYTVYTGARSPVPHAENPCKWFFEKLARKYGENQGQTLNLKSMRLRGRWSFPNRSGTAKCVNWDAIEEIHIDNTDSVESTSELSNVFGSYFPPRLRILSFSDTGPKSKEFLPSLLDLAHTFASGDDFGIISSADTDRSPRLLASTLGRIEDSNLVMAMFPLDKTRQGYESIVPQLPVPPSVTSLAIKAPPYVVGSEFLSLDLPRLCDSVAKLSALKAIWIMRPGVLSNDNAIYPSNMDRDGMIHSRILKGVEIPEKWRQAWNMQGCTLAAEQISKASRSLRYIRIGIQAWRIWRKDADGSKVSLEALDEWEDEVEGPELFHVPFPLPWNAEMHHVDWRYAGY